MKLKDFLLKVKTKVAELFGKLKKTAKEVIPVGIDIVNAMKKITDSPVADVFVEMTTFTNLDNIALEFARKWLPKVLKEMGEWNEDLNKSDNEIIKEAIVRINSYVPKKRNYTQLGIAASLNEIAADGEITAAQALTATHEAYNDPKLLNA